MVQASSSSLEDCAHHAAALLLLTIVICCLAAHRSWLSEATMQLHGGHNLLDCLTHLAPVLMNSKWHTSLVAAAAFC